MKKTKFFSLTALLFISISSLFTHDRNGAFCKPFAVTLKAGVSPTIITDPGSTAVAVRSFTPLVFEIAKDQKFDELWRNYPLTIDLDLSYAPVENIEFFAQFNYRHAQSKDNISFIGTGTTEEFGTITLNLDSFQALGGYVGSRFYTNRVMRNVVSFFVGSKVGLVHYKKIEANPFTITNQLDELLTQNVPWFESNNVVSGGLQIGFDVLITESFSLFFNAEVVASGPLKPIFNIIKENQTIFPDFTNVIRESSGTVVSFPITLGLRYYFGS